MNNISEDENKIILNSINAHGIYFKKSVRRELEKVVDLRICEEYPIHYFGGTQIDILARYQHENTLNILTIECKKAYAPYKKWIFFESCEAEYQLKLH